MIRIEILPCEADQLLVGPHIHDSVGIILVERVIGFLSNILLPPIRELKSEVKILAAFPRPFPSKDGKERGKAANLRENVAILR